MRAFFVFLKNFGLSRSRKTKWLILLSVDVIISIISSVYAFYLRLDEWVPFERAMPVIFLCMIMQVFLFSFFGLYSSVSRFSGFYTTLTFSRAFFIYFVLSIFTFSVIGIDGVPRTIGILQPLLSIALIFLTRVLLRWIFDNSRKTESVGSSALIYGAGALGIKLAAAFSDSVEVSINGFIDDDKSLWGRTINGLKVYSLDDVGQAVSELGIRQVFLAIPTTSRKRRNQIIGELQKFNINVLTIPTIHDLLDGKMRSLTNVQPLDLDDLLGREPVEPNDQLIADNNTGKTILVTGAGGSIGSELCRQVLRTNPKVLILVEMNEYALYKIERELTSFSVFSNGSILTEPWDTTVGDGRTQVRIISLLASVVDKGRIDQIFRKWRPDIVYHAAAYKHVPLVEGNIAEAIRNNVFGTKVCVEASFENGVSKFVLVSTDKAVRPTNVMGASKRLAEMVVQAVSKANTGTRSSACVVRFGNVIGSSGSVVPLFREQIENGGPITITHPEVTRYFMSIPEAAELVLQSGAMAVDGEVFILDMGEPIKIIDLARRMIQLSGLTAKLSDSDTGDIGFSFIGLRPGEKLYEELLIGNNPQTTEHERIFKAQEEFLALEELEIKLEILWDACLNDDIEKIISLLIELVNGYTPDQKLPKTHSAL